MRIHFESEQGVWLVYFNGMAYLILSDDEMTELIRAVDELKGRQ